MLQRQPAGYPPAVHALADFVARHAVGTLVVLTLLGILAVGAFWHVVHGYGSLLWRAAARSWTGWQKSAVARQMARLPVVGSFFVRSISVLRYLGAHAILSFVVAVVATTAFVKLGEEIGVGESLARFDSELASALRRHLSPTTLRVFSIITRLGDAVVLIPLAVGVTLGVALSRRWAVVVAWIVATAGGGLLNLLLKQIFARTRPPHDHGWVTETSYSFPSGHASGAVVVYGLLAYLIVRYSSVRWRVPVTMGAVALILFVGSSRVLLQVHYFSDVLAGYASAAAWVALCIAGLEAASARGAASEAGPTTE